MFSGLIWTGAKAVDLGLIDGLANESYVAREMFKTKTIVDYTTKEDVFKRLADKMGAGVKSMVSNLVNTPVLN
jgi:protease-4